MIFYHVKNIYYNNTNDIKDTTNDTNDTSDSSNTSTIMTDTRCGDTHRQFEGRGKETSWENITKSKHKKMDQELATSKPQHN